MEENAGKFSTAKCIPKSIIHFVYYFDNVVKIPAPRQITKEILKSIRIENHTWCFQDVL